jgi:hypothetical protein
MHHYLAGSRINLTYLQDRRELAGIDWRVVFADLTDDGAPPSMGRWTDLTALTHVVVATDCASGQYVGVLGLIERATTLEPYLLIETAMVRPGAKGIALRRAMLAHVLVRIVCLDGKPVALAAPRGDRSIEPALRDLGSNLTGAEVHPPVDGNVIVFRTASLARRIGTGGAVLDLRPVAEASLFHDLRGLHGARPERIKPPPSRQLPVEKPTAKPARSAGATRRPRKATHTGRTG